MATYPKGGALPNNAAILLNMLEPNFTPPDADISKVETQKRLNLIKWFSGYIASSVTGMLVCGSMSYGQNYSVKPSSDIDMQLLVTPTTILELLKTDCFDRQELEHALDGYQRGLYGQFSLVFNKDGVPMECHFWDEKAFIDAITFKSAVTKRLRTSIDIPSTDYAYSFDRDVSRKDYYGELKDGFAVADFPSYRRESRLYLCRPITGVLGLPLVEITSSKLDKAMSECWETAIAELKSFAGDKPIDLEITSIVNALPGKNKMSPESISRVQAKTNQLLQKDS